MCMGTPSAPPPPPPPAPAAPPVPAAVVAPAGGDGSTRRSDTSALQSNRGRASLRIDRTQPTTGNSGSGLNIPV